MGGVALLCLKKLLDFSLFNLAVSFVANSGGHAVLHIPGQPARQATPVLHRFVRYLLAYQVPEAVVHVRAVFVALVADGACEPVEGVVRVREVTGAPSSSNASAVIMLDNIAVSQNIASWPLKIE